jgi:queuine tRNA-ribosyltransferase
VRHSAPASILKSGSWRSDKFNIEWNLVEGDFLDHIDKSHQPHCIFFDPFSLNTNGALWNYSVFKRIFDHCANRPAKLFTYSSSTMVRGALLAAGFYTGSGRGTGPKTDTTAAFTTLDIKNSDIKLLGIDWLERFKRSSAKFDENIPEDEQELIEKLILNHPQFQEIKGTESDGE